MTNHKKTPNKKKRGGCIAVGARKDTDKIKNPSAKPRVGARFDKNIKKADDSSN